MSMLQEFFVFLTDLFQEGDGSLDAATVKQRMKEEGFDDVTAYDVQEAVALMYEEGDVFNSEQSSALNAYTGGNYVDQSFNGTNIGVASSGNAANTAAAQAPAKAAASSGGTGHSPAPNYSAPPPPPMDPAEGYTDLDAAVQQIVYVSNITNNTTINDNDVFEDNDTVVDSSVNQTILGGEVNQDFDTTVAGQDGIAVGADANVVDSNLVTGDNEGVIADDISDTNLVLGNADGSIVGDDNVGAVVGDNNDTTTLINSDGNATGDNSSVDNSVTNTTTVTNIGGDNINADGSNVTTIDGDNQGVVGTGGGGVEAINNSAVGQASFGDGDINNVIGNTVDESNFQIGDDNEGEVSSDDTFEATLDASVDVIDVDNSALIGSDLGIVDVEGPIEVAAATEEPAMEETETTGA